MLLVISFSNRYADICLRKINVLDGFCNKCTQNARDENILCNQMKSMFNSPMDMNDIGTMENFR